MSLTDDRVPPLAFLEGGGVTGQLIRAIDWGRTPLGAIGGWPASLKTLVGTILHSRHPMFLWWGPDLIQFYNDAYLPSLGLGKHPSAMGQRGEESWREIWPIIWPQIDDVMSRAKASWNEDALVPIFRNGRIEEVYWTYGYSPVFDESGAVGGTLVVCTETTSRVVSERRLRTLRAFVERTVLAASQAAVLESAAAVFGSEPADVPFALVYRSNPETQVPVLAQSIGIHRDDCAAVDAAVRDRLVELSRDPSAQPLASPVANSGNPWPEPVTHVFVARIASRLDQPPSGYVVFGVSPRLPFGKTYRDYFRQLAEHAATAQSRVETLYLRAVMENERNNLLEQAPVATALVTGADHVFQIANPLFEQLVGRTQMVGKTVVEAFPELNDTPFPGLLDRVYRSGKPFVTNEMLIPLDRDGSGRVEECYFKFNVEPMRNASGDVYAMMAVAVDITPQVSARRALEKAHGEREALLSELESAGRAKDEFLAMLGHELRNPLAPILTALQLMGLRGIKGAEKERAVIERQVRHVVRLVDDLLDVSRITRGKIQLAIEPVRLADVVAKGIEMASPIIEQRLHRLTVSVPDGLIVDGDAGRLAQVLSNVLTNAAKYTEPRGAIDVTAEQREGDAWVSVRDNGVGIDPAILPAMFRAFAQERQDSDRSQGGLGLGLAIVRNLVAAHGGSVMLESEGRGRGTVCIIRLPLSSASTFTSAPTDAECSGLPGGRDAVVLIVDDNVDAGEIMAESLRALGYVVRYAQDGIQALDIAEDTGADVAILDLGLPLMDGYEVAARLRALPRCSHIRLIALTGYGLESDRRRTREAGFDEHFVKPIDIDTLDLALRSLGPQRT
ncbi:MAG TPA: ATP-binding protein [Vicinamibacterales bacterium]|nr:ATP-binding protein [Vicinamibacterales bacterium]